MADAAQVAQIAQVGDGVSLIKFIAAFVFVIAGMLALAWALKRAGIAGHVLRTGQKRRLAVVESMPVDHRRRLVLVRRDNREHLILLGPDHAEVVEAGIPASAQPPCALAPAPEEDAPRATA